VSTISALNSRRGKIYYVCIPGGKMKINDTKIKNINTT
jgi:hypothetical protein